MELVEICSYATVWEKLDPVNTKKVDNVLGSISETTYV